MITANQIGGTESFVIEIENSKVAQLMEVFAGEFDQLIDHLKILNDRMVLVNPRFNKQAASDGDQASPE